MKNIRKKVFATMLTVATVFTIGARDCNNKSHADDNVEKIVTYYTNSKGQKVKRTVTRKKVKMNSSSISSKKDNNNEKKKEAVTYNDLTIKSPSKEEIRDFWYSYNGNGGSKYFYGLNLSNGDAQEIYDIYPNLEKGDKGKLSANAINDVLHLVNTMRFQVGLDSVSNDPDKEFYAQSAALLSNYTGDVVHEPAVPQGLSADSDIYKNGYKGAFESDLAMGYDFYDSYLSYLRDDSGEVNREELGHRRWLLNPALKTVGVGNVYWYNALYVTNGSKFNDVNADKTWAYPSNYTISEFHSEGSPLSFMYGNNYNFDNAQVVVTNLSNNERFTYTYDNGLRNKSRGIGDGNALSFGEGLPFAPGTKLNIKIENGMKNGKTYNVSYNVEYFSIQ